MGSNPTALTCVLCAVQLLLLKRRRKCSVPVSRRASVILAVFVSSRWIPRLYVPPSNERYFHAPNMTLLLATESPSCISRSLSRIRAGGLGVAEPMLRRHDPSTMGRGEAWKWAWCGMDAALMPWKITCPPATGSDGRWKTASGPLPPHPHLRSHDHTVHLGDGCGPDGPVVLNSRTGGLPAATVHPPVSHTLLFGVSPTAYNQP